ncbi:MAG: hypothetical protein A2Z20_00800 [Bdellovibrionales bacterium RBG_16_40_8]|nr:MAG: hypothetical protein A2Z20_00800 [Bdellovibrionales bacterium RBG_16_40_8]
MYVMIHECPKCGFVQPKDRYCANCGLDIDSYKPAPDSLFVKLSKNTGLQIALVIVLVSSLGIFIFLSQKNELETHQNQALQTLDAPNTGKPVKKIPAKVIVSKNPVTNIPSPPEEDGLADKNSNVLPQDAEASPLAIKPTERLSKELIINFVEASTALLQQLANEGQILNETAQRRAFIHKRFESLNKLKDRDLDFKILPGGRKQAIQVNSPASFDFSHAAVNNEDIGFNIEFTATSNTESTIELNLVGLLNLKGEGNSSVANQEFTGNYVFSPNSTLVLVGFLPRQPIREEDHSTFSNTPLVIFESLQFLSGQTDFAVFVDAR